MDPVIRRCSFHNDRLESNKSLTQFNMGIDMAPVFTNWHGRALCFGVSAVCLFVVAEVGASDNIESQSAGVCIHVCVYSCVCVCVCLCLCVAAYNRRTATHTSTDTIKPYCTG